MIMYFKSKKNPSEGANIFMKHEKKIRDPVNELRIVMVDLYLKICQLGMTEDELFQIMDLKLI